MHNRARTLSDLVLLVVAVAVAAAAIAVIDIAARRVPDGAEEVVARALAVEAGGGRLLWVLWAARVEGRGGAAEVGE